MTKAPLYNLRAENLGEVTLPKKVFEIKYNPQLIATVLRVYRHNQRTAHAKVKDRGEVAGTTKKMWAQKGTGHARHGSAKAGIFVGGGSVHGPQGNQFPPLFLNQKVKKAALNCLLSRFASQNSILVIDQFKDLLPKTKAAFNFIDTLEKQSPILAKSKKIGIITTRPLAQVKRAFSNISGINYFSLKSLNALHLAQQNVLIFSRKSISALEK